ncbi:uncharacterized protein LOC108319816 [Vigna angularis]|uniref:uncharacterized protein LOC108319816 n=1 Tax=Phaseolus angularis TaxID=3914 RepID=UPI00080A1F6A|nr:uncharacterized protein LOC108319816 [Vigna angularis]
MTKDEKELWSTLDAMVFFWLYAVISNDPLHRVIELDATTMDAWNRLRDIFQDTKHSRVVSKSHLVIQLVSGLRSAYHGVGTLIRQSDPLPLFYQVQSMLILKEARLGKEAATSS